MELNIVSSEILKPSSPTPHHLRTHKLSILDQLAPDCFFHIIFFYSGASDDTKKLSDRLKNSLSKTLTHYYPLAGRVKDEFSIDCDDYGAAFIESRVAEPMSVIFNQSENRDFIEQLVPYKLNEKPSFPVSLVVQVTCFDCGGIAICLGFSHFVADITTAANFIKSWTAISCGSDISNSMPTAIPDCSSIFPPQNFLGFSTSSSSEKPSPSTEIITKRFTFDGSKIAALKEKYGNESSSGYYPTRVEVVSALILGGVLTAAREGDEFNYTHLVAGTAVNLRNKLNPPLPKGSIGNLILTTTANWPMEKSIDCNKLIEKFHESISKINNDYVRKVQADGGFLNYMKNLMEGVSMDSSIKWFQISSWLRLSFYEADFGWGKPMWVGFAMKYKDVAVLFDSSDGKGIEAWVGMSKKEMAKFEQDPGILANASIDPSLF